jgi:hypothetical protein
MLTQTDHEALEQLEESLWRTQTRFDRDHMETLLSEHFREFGRSGRVYNRAEILKLEPAPIDATLHDLTVRPLAPNVALITYISELRRDSTTERSNRSSIWTRHENHWQLEFHQGTPTAHP